MTELTLSLADAADVAAIAELEWSYYGADGYPAALFYQALQQWPQGLWVAKRQQLLGYLLIAPASGADTHWLMSMLVAPQARGQGLGKALLQHVLTTNTELGCIRLTVASDNHTAQRIYQQCGFTKIDEIADFFGPGAHRWLFEWRR
jgi:ribosomal-protein-alanine N-acetyltransferase